MKLKNGFLTLALLGMILTGRTAHAVIFPDQNAAAFGETDDENQDAVSRFGSSDTAKKKTQAVARVIEPISNSSFEEGSSRGPASVGGSTRGPATVRNTKLRPSDTGQSKQLIVNQVKREKAYQEVAVIANDSGFYPSTVFLTQGIPVRIFITGASAKSQCFMLDQFGVRRQIRSQKIEEVTFTPDAVGTFAFSCPMNGAKGSVVVKELEVGGRVPASVSVSHSDAVPIEATVPVENKKSEIEDTDFTPEFRNN
jgi:hypothetical protein